MPFPARAFSNTYNQPNAETFDVPINGGTVVAEQLILVFVAYDQGWVGSINATNFPGWAILLQTANGTTVTGLVAWKRATGGETNLVIDWNTLDRGSAIVEVWDDAGDPTAASSTGSSTNCDPPSHTAPTSADHTWIACACIDSLSVATAAPTNYANLLSVTGSSGGGSTATANRQIASSQTENPGAFTSPTDQWVGLTVAIPVDAGGGVTGTGAAALVLTQSGSGVVVVDSSGASPLALAQVGVGVVRVVGTGIAAFVLDSDGAGAVQVKGSGASAVVLTQTGAGTVANAPITGTGTAALALTQTGAGVVAVQGAGAAPLVLAQVGTGAVWVRGAGTAALVLTQAGTATGAAATAALSGTIIGATEGDIRAGGRTIILTLSGGAQWIAA